MQHACTEETRLFLVTSDTYLSDSEQLKGGKPVSTNVGTTLPLATRAYVPVRGEHELVHDGDQARASAVEQRRADALNERHSRRTGTTENHLALAVIVQARERESKQSNARRR